METKCSHSRTKDKGGFSKGPVSSVEWEDTKLTDADRGKGNGGKGDWEKVDPKENALQPLGQDFPITEDPARRN